MTVKAILTLLFDTGHFRSPMNRGGASWNITRADLPKLRLNHPAVQEAVRSYQDFMAVTLEPFSMALHSRPAIHDGEVGPATTKLFKVERCGCPDYHVEGAEEHYSEAIGSGSWPANCLPAWKDTHAITINIDKRGMQSFESDVFESHIWPNVVASYVEMGLLLVREDGNTKANLQASWVTPDGGWIGLAIVPSRTSCSLSIWQRYDKNYRPANIINERGTLIRHETGHNLGLNHTPGGVMNPSIVRGLANTWKGDPSEPLLKRWFGGVPVAGGPGDVEMWTESVLRSNRGRELVTKLRPPIITGQ